MLYPPQVFTARKKIQFQSKNLISSETVNLVTENKNIKDLLVSSSIPEKKQKQEKKTATALLELCRKESI